MKYALSRQAEAPVEPQHLDAWGLPIVPPDPPAADPELGWTTSEDAPLEWAASVLPPDEPRYGWLILLAAMHKGRYWILRSGIGRNSRR